MKQRIPGVESVEAQETQDGYIVLRFQDGKFKNPFSSKFVSDGTIKMFTYLVLLEYVDKMKEQILMKMELLIDKVGKEDMEEFIRISHKIKDVFDE